MNLQNELADTSEAGQAADNICAICLGDMSNSDVTTLNCQRRHTFHMNCLQEWLISSQNDGGSRCPTCNRSITSSRTIQAIGKYLSILNNLSTLDLIIPYSSSMLADGVSGWKEIGGVAPTWLKLLVSLYNAGPDAADRICQESNDALAHELIMMINKLGEIPSNEIPPDALKNIATALSNIKNAYPRQFRAFLLQSRHVISAALNYQGELQSDVSKELFLQLCRFIEQELDRRNRHIESSTDYCYKLCASISALAIFLMLASITSQSIDPNPLKKDGTGSLHS